MKTLRIFLCAAPLLMVSLAVSARAQQTVTFPSGEATAQGVLFLPHGAGPHPAVALAVDLYRGKVATTPDLAHELSRGLPQDQGVRDLTAALAYLAARPDVKRDRIGAVGWCMGGGYALQLAIAAPSLRAVGVNYGSLPTDKDALAKIHAAVLGNFGGQDHGIPPESVHAFEAAMKSLGKPVDAKIYPEAGHAFENSTNQAGYRAADAADAMARLDHFFAGTLGR
jgi:carboxymethylenebutenolidase